MFSNYALFCFYILCFVFSAVSCSCGGANSNCIFYPTPPVPLSDLSALPLSSKSCQLSLPVAVFPFPKPCILNHTAQCSLVSSVRHSESCLPLLSGPTWQCDRSCTGTCNCPRQKAVVNKWKTILETCLADNLDRESVDFSNPLVLSASCLFLRQHLQMLSYNL